MAADTGQPPGSLPPTWHGPRLLHAAARSLACAALILLLVIGVLLLCYSQLPDFTADELEVLKRFPPRQLPILVAQRDVLLNYADANPYAVACAFCACYIAMQTCAIPGTLTLSLLGGALYGMQRGLLLVAVVSTLGSTCCYVASALCGRQLVQALWPRRLDAFAEEVAARRSALLNYVIFLRVTPLLPNTFINVASPIVGVPLPHFVMGTLLGCLPNNILVVSAGSRLSELSSLQDLYNAKVVGLCLAIGVLALLPVYLSRKEQQQTHPSTKRD